jgi:PQQ-like domain
VDMQASDGYLLVSSPRMLAMYATGDLSKPLWSDLKRMDRFTWGNAPYRPRFAGQSIITSYDNRMVGLNRADGTLVGDASPHDPHSLRLYRPMGSPLVADHKAFGVQAVQTSTILERWPPETRNYADIALSCYGLQGMEHRWTRVYDVAQTIGEPPLEMCVGAEPQTSDGAVYFCSNSGRVIRADFRDGEMDWIHFFRPLAHPDDVPSQWNLGTSSIVTGDKVICMPKHSGRPFALDKETGRCVWRTPLLRGRELLGICDDLLLVVGDNSLYGIEVHTGKMRWGQRLSVEHVNGLQLPRAQLIGSSVYCGTKNSLQRFDARNGSLLESRPWNMDKQRPMSFMIQGTDLYVISDLPLRNEFHDRQIVACYTRGSELVGQREAIAMKRKDGTMVIWGDCMVMCVREGQLVWNRFVSNSVAHRSTIEDHRDSVRLSWNEASSDHDMATGELLVIRKMPPPNTGR